MKGGRMKSVTKIVEEQVNRWQLLRKEQPKEIPGISVVTLSGEPGSNGRIVALRLAEKRGIDIFDKQIINEMAKSADVRVRLVASLDERGLSMLEDWVSAAVLERHLWPDEYSQHLMKVIGTIGKHGRAVIVGRGANFILPREERFAVRVVAPLKWRVDNISRMFGISTEDARRRATRTESHRRAFIRKYFNADIAWPTHYDLVINCATLSVDDAVKVISASLDTLTSAPED
jgi:cytidylate kinase